MAVRIEMRPGATELPPTVDLPLSELDSTDTTVVTVVNPGPHRCSTRADPATVRQRAGKLRCLQQNACL